MSIARAVPFTTRRSAAAKREPPRHRQTAKTHSKNGKTHSKNSKNGMYFICPYLPVMIYLLAVSFDPRRVSRQWLLPALDWFFASWCNEQQLLLAIAHLQLGLVSTN